jgi:hypothetical protein
MAPDGRAETCSWEVWLKIHYNNCPIEHCVILYILYIRIYITIENNGDVTWKSRTLVIRMYCGWAPFIKPTSLSYCGLRRNNLAGGFHLKYTSLARYSGGRFLWNVDTYLPNYTAPYVKMRIKQVGGFLNNETALTCSCIPMLDATWEDMWVCCVWTDCSRRFATYWRV